MKRKLAWWIVPVIAVVLWLVLRDRGEPLARGTRPPVSAIAAAGASGTSSGAPGQPAGPRAMVPEPSTGVTSAPAPVAAGAGTAPASAPSPRGARPRDGAPPGSGVVAASQDEARSGQLLDRTGWNDASVARQLNKELMPLASECIDQAQARKPTLRGLLGFTMVVAPTENGRVIVTQLKLRPDNQIDDPELFECLRESSFALEGLTAPHDFDLTMPIEPPHDGPPTSPPAQR